MLQTFLLLGFSILATVSAQLLLKKGMMEIGQLNFSPTNLLNLIGQIFHNIYLLSGLASFGLSFFSWLFILSKLQLNIAYPIITSLNFCLIIFGSWFLFKEQISFYQILGIGFIVLGIFLLLKN
ncbi:MAG: EamA family transporter [Patescibacteria group bacterium]